MKQMQKRSEFRKNKVSGHPAYIYAKVGNEFIYLGLTHSAIDKKSGKINILLECNPNPKDSQDAYIKTQSETLKSNKFSKQPYKNWSFTPNDQKKVDKIKKRTK